MARVSRADIGQILDAARARGESLACAESLTGGALTAALVSVPGASDVVRGAVVAYTVEMKRRMLNVDPGLLDAHGPVSAEVASAMAAGVCATTGASIGVATTGVAGPQPHGGHPSGTAWIATAGIVNAAVLVRASGDRTQVVQTVVNAALGAFAAALDLEEITARVKAEHN